MTVEAGLVVVGYGEIGTKSAEVRRKLLDRLAANIRAVLTARGLAADVETTWARILVHTESPSDAAAAAATVPGVVWARPARECSPRLDAIRDTLVAVARSAEADGEPASFAVRAERAGPSDAHPFRSADVEREGGAAVQAATGTAVDLDAPDVTYRVDCREECAYVSRRSVDGPGGLPVGSQGTVVALVSGGIDSPVAAWQAMRRGCTVVPVYVDLGVYGGADHRERAVSTVQTLAERAPHADTHLRVVPGGDVVERLVDVVCDTRMLSVRRAMLRMAAVVADAVSADALVTGESLGQKSSQTGPNLRVTDAAVDYPVHRPLLTWDKSDIVDAARDLGTFEDATLPVGCERIAPSHPETSATLAAVRAAEPDDLFSQAEQAADRAERLD